VNATARRLMLASAVLMGLVIGGRSAFGLFVSSLNTASGMGLAALSFALALGRLGVGLAQPVVGAWADRYGAARVIVSGALSSSEFLLGEVARAVSVARVGMAVGLVGADGSAGSLVLGPATQWVIDQNGGFIALLAMAALSMAVLPIALLFRRKAAAPAAQPSHPAHAVQPCRSFAFLLRERRFLQVAAGLGACGFHVGVLRAHMPGGGWAP
jgi:sugar phosphate permease